MAGQHVTPTTELPIETQVLGFSIGLTAAETGDFSIPLFTAPCRMVIHKAVLRHENGDDGITPEFLLAKRSNGSTTDSAITTAQGVGAAGANTNKTLTLVTTNGVPSNNILEEGDTLMGVFDDIGGACLRYGLTITASARVA